MATNKYSNGKVYRLVNNVDNEEYVGSTIQSLIQRKGGHKGFAKIKPNQRVYNHLNSVGWDNVEIVLIENYPCQSKEELNARERYWIETLEPSLNKNVPSRTDKEYHKDHADKYKAYNREYYQQNADKLKEKMREYNQKNADKINDYLQQNAEKIKEYYREYYLRKKAEREAQQSS